VSLLFLSCQVCGTKAQASAPVTKAQAAAAISKLRSIGLEDAIIRAHAIRKFFERLQKK